MATYNKKNRAIVSGIFVGLASIYAIASHFDMEQNLLNSFLFSTVLFFVGIVLLAALALLAFKGVTKLFRSSDKNPNDASDKPE